MVNIFTQVAVQISAGQVNVLPLTAGQIVGNILNITYFVAGVIAVIVIILAGLSYITSSGNAAGVSKAKNAILYSVIGLVIVLMAFVITQYVIGRF